MTAEPDQPCPACQRVDLDADTCRARPKCLTCPGTTHLPAWGCCDTCVAAVDRMLAELLDLHALASTTLEPAGSGMHARSAPRSAPPLNIGALDLAIGTDLLAVLEQWERWWREHWSLTPYGVATETLPRPHRPGDATLMHVIGFLRTWWPRAAQTVEPPPDEFAAEVRALHRSAMAALALTRFDLDPDPDAAAPPDFTIACPADHPDHPDRTCGYRLGVHRAPRPLPDQAQPTVTLDCPRCLTRWDIRRLLLVARAAGVRVEMSKAEACAWYDTTARGLAVLVRTGRVQRTAGRYTPADTASA